MFLAVLAFSTASVKGHPQEAVGKTQPPSQARSKSPAGPATFNEAAPRSATDQSATDQFVEVSNEAGIHFTLTSGGLQKRYIIEAKGGGGVAWIDYNNDGFPDLFFVNGSTFEHWKCGDSPRSALYRNNGDGTFTTLAPAPAWIRPAGVWVCAWATTTTMASTICT